MKKIPAGAEAANILVGEVDCLDKRLVAFVRLSRAVLLGDVTEVPVPTRFVFLYLVPKASAGTGGGAGAGAGNGVGVGVSAGASQSKEIGRAFATLMSDQVFHEIAYRSVSLLIFNSFQLLF